MLAAPHRIALAAALACSGPLAARADITFSAELLGSTRVADAPLVDNAGRIAFNTYEGITLLTPRAEGGFDTSRFELPGTAGIANARAQLAGLSLGSGQWLVQVVQQQPHGTVPVDSWIARTGTNDWTRVAALPGALSAEVRGAIATGLADDGRVLLQAAPTGAFFVRGDRTYPAAYLDGGVVKVLPGYYDPPSRVLMNGQRLIAFQSDVFDLSALGLPGAPMPRSSDMALPSGTWATAMNGLGGVVGGTLLSVPVADEIQPRHAVIDVNTLLAPGAPEPVAALSGLNDRGQLVGTTAAGLPVLLRTQGTRDYVGVGGGAERWSSSFVAALLPPSETDYRMTSVLDNGDTVTADATLAELGLHGVPVRSLRIGGSAPGSDAWLTLNGGRLVTRGDLTVAVGQLRVRAPSALEVGRLVVEAEGRLRLDAPADVLAPGGVHIDGSAEVAGGRWRVGSGNAATPRGTITGGGTLALGDGAVVEADVHMGNLVAGFGSGNTRSRIEGTVTVALRPDAMSARLFVDTGAQLEIGGPLITASSGNVQVRGSDPSRPGLRGGRLVVGAIGTDGRWEGDPAVHVLSNVNGSVVVEAGGSLAAGGYRQVWDRRFSAVPPVLTMDGTLDTWGGDVRIEGGTLNGNGIINLGVGGSDGRFPVLRVGGGSSPAWVRPGHSPGRLMVNGAFVLDTQGVLELEVQRGTDGALQWDRLDAASMSFLDGSQVRVLVGAGVAAADLLRVGLLGCGSGCRAEPGAVFAIDGISGITLALDASGLHLLTAVPEPGTAALWMAGVALLAARRRAAGLRMRTLEAATGAKCRPATEHPPATAPEGM